MPHVDELSTSYQNALKREIPARTSVQLKFDPDDLNVDLSDYINQSSRLSIRKSKQIQPFGTLGKYQVSEVTLDMINDGDYFNPNTVGNQFYYAASRLLVAKGSSDAFIQLIKGEAAKFDHANITTVFVSDGSNRTEFTISSIDETDPDFDQINFSASGSIAYAAGSVVETPYMPGKPATLKITVDGVGSLDLFYGVMKAHPTLPNGGAAAKLVLYDDFRTLLDIELKANDYRTPTDTNGNTQSTITYNRADDPESDGLLDLSAVTIYSARCQIGTWKIVHDGLGNYTLTDINGDTYTSDTSSTLNVPDATAPQLRIPPAAWSGSFDNEDEITFQTVCYLGSPANSYYNIPAMIEALLTEDFGADLVAARVDSSAFTELKRNYRDMFGVIAFTNATTVLKAIETLQSHVSVTVYHKGDGTVSIAGYRPQLLTGTIPTLSPDADIMELDQDDLGSIDKVIVEYDYSYTSREYLKRIVIPDGSVYTTEKILTVKFPAYHDEAQALAAGERIWVMWRKGVKSYQITEKWNYGLGLAINDIVKISSTHPLIPERYVEIYEIDIDPVSRKSVCRAYDLNHSFDKFAFADVDYLDSGKVVW